MQTSKTGKETENRDRVRMQQNKACTRLETVRLVDACFCTRSKTQDTVHMQPVEFGAHGACMCARLAGGRHMVGIDIKSG